MSDKAINNPIERFREWYEALPRTEDDKERTAMTLATASKQGVPSARVVLLKSYDERGFVFYTNLESHKSQDLTENPYAALCFNWMPQLRQVRITGRVEKTTDAEADAYYNSRPFESRIGAWASAQSRPLESRKALLDSVAILQKKYSEANPPPRPPHWSGWRVVPQQIEFWQEASHRLHDRDVYTRTPQGWTVHKLYP
jgi:pyridoxamine 5'-phosphate oxidase